MCHSVRQTLTCLFSHPPTHRGVERAGGHVSNPLSPLPVPSSEPELSNPSPKLRAQDGTPRFNLPSIDPTFEPTSYHHPSSIGAPVGPVCKLCAKISVSLLFCESMISNLNRSMRVTIKILSQGHNLEYVCHHVWLQAYYISCVHMCSIFGINKRLWSFSSPHALE